MEAKKKILVVDDEEVILTLFCDFLDTKGYEVILARDGEEAIRKIKEEKFDLAFVDVVIPKIDGLEVLRTIKKTRPKTVVIMITAYEVEDMLKQAREEGAYTCLRKPFRIKEVLDILEKVVANNEK